MANKTLIFLCILVTGVSCLNIQQIIDQREELSDLREYMKKGPVNMWSTLGQEEPGNKYTFFAPSNLAFSKAPRSVLDRFRSSSVSATDLLNNIIKYHTVYHIGAPAMMVAELTDMSKKTMATNAPRIFFRMLNGNVYVNGGRVTEGDMQASNGMIHIIDAFLYEPGETETAWGYIEKQSQVTMGRFSKFWQLLGRYDSTGIVSADTVMNNGDFVTIFLPTDEAINMMPKEYFEKLQRDTEQLKKVIESHVISTAVYHAGVLNATADMPMGMAPTIQAMEGHIKARRFGPDLYISNNCVQGLVTKGDITVSNGVIHHIDNILGYLYNDVYDQVKNDPLLDAFEGHMTRASPQLTQELRVPAASLVTDTDKLTVFAPVNLAFYGTTIDLTQNITQLDNVLRMHMMRGVYDTSSFETGLFQHETLRPNFQAKIFQDGLGDVYVEVDHVKAKIVKSDMCVKNGIVHYIDRILGVPLRSAFTEIRNNDQFTDLYEAIRYTGLEISLSGNNRVTVFAPIDKGFERMRQTSVGSQILDSFNSQKLRNVLKRHIVDGDVYLEELSGTNEVQSQFGKWKINKVAQDQYVIEYGDGPVRIRVLNPDIKMQNGVLHIIEDVIYEDSPLELALTSAATSWTAHLLILLLSATLSLCYFVSKD